MLYCPRCDISESGNASYAVCDLCGGKFIVVKDHSRNNQKRDHDCPEELELGMTDEEFKRNEKPNAQPWSRIKVG
jgi:hypothetical protein